MENLQAFYDQLELQDDPLFPVKKDEVSDSYLYRRISAIDKKDTVFVNGLVAEGGQKKVYKAELEDGRQIAVATVHEPSCIWSAEKLCKEAFITQRLEHPHILSVYDYGIDYDFGPYIAMPYIPGKTLAEINFEELSSYTLLDLLRQICQALSFAHSRDVYHGDIKAENILLDEQGHIYLLDWGAAYALPSMSDECSLNPLLLGDNQPEYFWATLGAVPPEIKSSKTISEKTDIFQFGVMLAGLLKDLPDSLIKRCLVNLARKASHPNAEKRFESLREVLGKLDEIPLKSKTLTGTNAALALSALFLFSFFLNFYTFNLNAVERSNRSIIVESISSQPIPVSNFGEEVNLKPDISHSQGNEPLWLKELDSFLIEQTSKYNNMKSSREER